MPKSSKKRAYHSPMRERQADETFERICAAARRLMTREGFDGTTIEAVAREAGVSPQTVYATFGSKKGILAALVTRARFGPAFEEALARAMDTTDPELHLALVAGIARSVYDGERSELEVLRGAGVVAPELAEMTREVERNRYERQAKVIELLVATRRLKAGLGVKAARDVLWTLTGRENYSLLVIERGWSPDRYEAWLGELLQASLLAPVRGKTPPPG